MYRYGEEAIPPFRETLAYKKNHVRFSCGRTSLTEIQTVRCLLHGQ